MDWPKLRYRCSWFRDDVPTLLVAQDEGCQQQGGCFLKMSEISPLLGLLPWNLVHTIVFPTDISLFIQHRHQGQNINLTNTLAYDPKLKLYFVELRCQRCEWAFPANQSTSSLSSIWFYSNNYCVKMQPNRTTSLDVLSCLKFLGNHCINLIISHKHGGASPYAKLQT